MADTSCTVQASELSNWAASVYMNCGVPREHAQEAADILVRTNLRGVDTHGIVRIADYVAKLKTLEINPDCKPQFEWRANTLLCDGAGGLGQYVGSQAVTAAIERAKTAPVVSCFLRGSGHLAALGMFALQAAEQDMIALICQETPPLMGLPGSRGPAIGNNPIAFAMPMRNQAPIVFDMATSIVSRGAVMQLGREGKAIPEGWAIDENGIPTIDPNAALAGAMLPMGGHKGIGLAMMVQCLAGSLTGSATASSAAQFGAKSSAGNVSAFILVINPDLVLGRDAFFEHAESWMNQFKAASGLEARYPGERAAESENRRRLEGISLPAAVVDQLVKVGGSVGVAWPFERMETA